MVVNLGKGPSLNGAIAAAETIHVDENGNQNTHFTIDEYYYLGHFANRNFFNSYNFVDVNVTDSAVWTVIGDSLLTSLTIGEDSTVKVPASKSLKATVDSVETTLEADKTYTGLIVNVE